MLAFCAMHDGQNNISNIKMFMKMIVNSTLSIIFTKTVSYLSLFNEVQTELAV